MKSVKEMSVGQKLVQLAKEIIEQNKGSIDIKSEYGKGTEVVIRIPALKKEEEK